MDAKLMPYELKRQTERFGDIELSFFCLKDLDQTIDQMFERLSQEGRGELLKELCPYFGTLWPAARILAQAVVALDEASLRGRSLLEVGCGLALPSFVALRRGALVTASDCHPDVPSFLAKNAGLNGVSDLHYVTSDWQGEKGVLGLFDWVIASDVLYEHTQAVALATYVDVHLAPDGAVLLTDPSRPYLQDFVSAMEARGFHYQLDTAAAAVAGGDRDIFMLCFRRGSAQPKYFAESQNNLKKTAKVLSSDPGTCDSVLSPESFKLDFLAETKGP